jgi:ribosomal protein S18 acetylase RimI-like enzyme
MTRDELILLADLNQAEANRELARRAGGAVVDEDGLVLWAGAHPLPVLCNAVMRLGGTLTASDVIARADQFFAARNRGYTIIVRAHADADLAAAASAEGLALFGETPGMIVERRVPDRPLAAGVSIRQVTTADDVEAFAAISGEAYATYGMPADVTPLTLANPDVLIAPHIRSYLALVDGVPKAAAMVILTHGIGGIYWVGTVPDARGRGLAELVTRTATNAGFDLGARVVTLQASVMGEPVYRRMGYVEVTRYPQWIRMSPPSC